MDKQAKKFVQISVPRSFAEKVRAKADLSGRSIPGEIEHLVMIGEKVEAFAPTTAIENIKQGRVSDLMLRQIGMFLLSTDRSSLEETLTSVDLPRYGVDTDDPSITLRIDPDGTVTKGHRNAQGEFVPLTLVPRRSHEPEPARPKRKSAHRPAAERGRQAVPA